MTMRNYFSALAFIAAFTNTSLAETSFVLKAGTTSAARTLLSIDGNGYVHSVHLSTTHEPQIFEASASIEGLLSPAFERRVIGAIGVWGVSNARDSLGLGIAQSSTRMPNQARTMAIRAETAPLSDLPLNAFYAPTVAADNALGQRTGFDDSKLIGIRFHHKPEAFAARIRTIVGSYPDLLCMEQARCAALRERLSMASESAFEAELQALRHRSSEVRVDGALALDLLDRNIEEMEFIYELSVTDAGNPDLAPLVSLVDELRGSLRSDHSARGILNAGINAGGTLKGTLGTASNRGVEYLLVAFSGLADGSDYTTSLTNTVLAEQLYFYSTPPAGTARSILINLRVRAP